MSPAARRAAKARARECLVKNRLQTIYAGIILVVMAVLVWTLLRSNFSPTLDATQLINAASNGADSLELYAMMEAQLIELLIPRNIVLILVIFLAGVVAGGPAVLGTADVLLRLSRGEDARPREIFRWYTVGSRPFRAMLLYLIFFIITAVVGVACLLVSGLLLGLLASAVIATSSALLDALYTLMTPVLYFCSYCLVLLVLGRFISAFIFMPLNELGVFASLKAAWKVSRGHSGEFFGFLISFTLWILLCAFTFGLMLVFAAPFFFLALAEFIKEFQDGN